MNRNDRLHFSLFDLMLNELPLCRYNYQIKIDVLNKYNLNYLNLSESYLINIKALNDKLLLKETYLETLKEEYISLPSRNIINHYDMLQNLKQEIGKFKLAIQSLNVEIINNNFLISQNIYRINKIIKIRKKNLK